mmetsp:Transcript_88281/g.270129  ORF Transcript_88281/g.270129 Transcript_88281/m.270129 type:complete len:214 (+) Transcript_88281:755-1396(+)
MFFETIDESRGSARAHRGKGGAFRARVGENHGVAHGFRAESGACRKKAGKRGGVAHGGHVEGATICDIHDFNAVRMGQHRRRGRSCCCQRSRGEKAKHVVSEAEPETNPVEAPTCCQAASVRGRRPGLLGRQCTEVVERMLGFFGRRLKTWDEPHVGARSLRACNSAVFPLAAIDAFCAQPFFGTAYSTLLDSGDAAWPWFCIARSEIAPCLW